MRRILDRIQQRKREFESLPFFTFLRDTRLPAAERFAFVPAGAPFIMAFADLNKYTLFSAQPKDPIEELINVHSREDMTHYEMYLRDLHTLGYDRPLKLTDALEFLWSDERRCSRRACYDLGAMLEGASLRHKLVIIETIEAMGSVAFRTFTGLAAEYRTETGRTLSYFGKAHEDLESGHTMGTPDIEDRLHAIELTDEEFAYGVELVDTVHGIFTGMMNELHAFALRPAPLPQAEPSAAPASP